MSLKTFIKEDGSVPFLPSEYYAETTSEKDVNIKLASEKITDRHFYTKTDDYERVIRNQLPALHREVDRLLSDSGFEILKFIATFEFVQFIQIKRQVQMFPMIFGKDSKSGKKANWQKDLDALQRLGLIEQYTVMVAGRNVITAFALTTDGFNYVKRYGDRSAVARYRSPASLLRYRDVEYWRLFAIVDIYQTLVNEGWYRSSRTNVSGLGYVNNRLWHKLPALLEMNTNDDRSILFYSVSHQDTFNRIGSLLMEFQKVRSGNFEYSNFNNVKNSNVEIAIVFQNVQMLKNFYQSFSRLVADDKKLESLLTNVKFIDLSMWTKPGGAGRIIVPKGTKLTTSHF